MSTVEVGVFIGSQLLVAGGIISMGQARWYDGDADALYWRGGWSPFYVARHPVAVRAMRRGRVLLASGVVAALALVLFRALARL